MVANVDGLAKIDTDFFGHDQRMLRQLEPFQHQHKLVTAHPRHRVTLPHAQGQTSCCLLQQVITNSMPVVVVNKLEVVEVDIEHGQALVVALCAYQCAVQAIVKQLSIGQVSQGIVLRQILQAGMQLLAFNGRGHLGRHVLQQIPVLLGVTLFSLQALDHQRPDNAVLGCQRYAQP